MKTIQKSIVINASKEKVWDVLTKNELNRVWLGYFSENTHVDTDWQIGSSVIFTDHSGTGLFGKVTENTPREPLSITYEGEILNGKKETETENAKTMIGTKEIYRLNEENGSTTLLIASDMREDFIDEMSIAWDGALEKIKELAEK